MATARKRTTRKTTARKRTARKPATRKPAKSAAKRKSSRTASAARARTATRARKPARKPARKAAARKPARKPARKAAARKPARKSAKASAAKKATVRTVTKVVTKVVQAPPAPPNPVQWFEIPVTDMQRAQSFYEGVLQIRLQSMPIGPGSSMMAFPMRGPTSAGTTGALMKSETYTPSHAGSMVYFEVDDIDATLSRAQMRGGRVLNPKMSIGEYGTVAHFEDSEGNRIALHSMK